MTPRPPCLALHRLLAAALLLLVVLGVASTARAQAPTCSGLTLRTKIRSSPKTLAPGTRVSVGLTVKNTGVKAKSAGAKAVSGVTVRVSSSVLADWKATGLAAKSSQIDGDSVYWLDQTLKPGQVRRYKAHARICAAAVGSPVVVEAAVYRLNATTGDVLCSTGATPMNVGRLGRAGPGRAGQGTKAILVSFDLNANPLLAVYHCEPQGKDAQGQPGAPLPRADPGA